jgi:hypothetical protein
MNGAIRDPSEATSATRFASAIAIGSLNQIDIGVTGIHAACAFSRSHRNEASNGLRVL